MMATLLLGTALAAEGYNQQVETSTTVTWHPALLLSGALTVGTEFRVPGSDLSASFLAGPYAWDGAVGGMSIFQLRRYVVGDFDRGLYFGGHVGGSLAADEYYWYYTAILAGVTGGKWVWDSGLTIDQNFGVGVNLAGVTSFLSLGLGWSW